MKIGFEHKQSAHCENGVTSNLLRFHGIDLDESMVFGIGSGLFFSFIPFIKINRLPGISFRIFPGLVFSRVCKRLGVKLFKKTFSNPQESMSELDREIDRGIPVGLQVGVFHLDYFPAAYRFHFNAHNIVVFGRENGKYLISDPVIEHPVELSYDVLQKVRFAKGVMQPRGRMYYPVKIPEKYDLPLAIKKGIQKTCKDMLGIPIPLFGAKGIRTMAGYVRKWPQTKGLSQASFLLGQIIRMAEEIGTGGAGFRFIFAAFLQKSSRILGNSELSALSEKMTSIGDRWREFALIASRNCKNRAKPEESYDLLADILLELAEREKNVYNELIAAIK